MQDDIAQSVVQGLRAALMDEEPDAASACTRQGRGARGNARPHRQRRGARALPAGRFLIDRFTRDDTATGVRYCRQSLEADPRYALAWAGLAGAYSSQAACGWAPLGETFELARSAALRALELQPDLAEAHAELGWVRMTYDWDWHGADASYRRALTLGSGNRSIVVAASLLADNVGRNDDAVALARRAVALDPLSFIAQGNLGLRCFNAGLLDEAVAAVESALALNPHGTLLHWLLGTIRLEQRRPDEALAAFEREQFDRLRVQGLALLHHASGRHDQAQAALDALIEIGAGDSAFQIAEVFACRGDADRAFEWLERAYEQRDPGVSQMQSGPLLRNLHGDPRWPLFLDRMGLSGSRREG